MMKNSSSYTATSHFILPDYEHKKRPRAARPKDAIVHAAYFALEPVRNYIVLLAPSGAYNTSQKNLSMALRHPVDYRK